MGTPPNQPMAIDPATTIKVGGSTLHIVGHKQRDAGNTVLCQVFVNCNVSQKTRGKALVALPLHEIPLHRLKQAESGGTIEILNSWAPSLPQVRGMTKLQLEDELTRLRGKVLQPGSPAVGGAYCVARGEREINLFTQLYGGENGVKVSLFSKMGELYEGWKRLSQLAVDEMRRITPDEIEELIHRVVLPDTDADEIDAIPDVAKEVADGLADSNAVEVNGDLREFLLSKEVNDAVVEAFITEVARAQGGKHDLPLEALPEEAWARIPGVGRHAQKRAALMKSLESYLKVSSEA